MNPVSGVISGNLYANCTLSCAVIFYSSLCVFYVLVNSVKIGVLKSMAAVMMKFTTSLIVNGQDAFYVYIFYCISIYETVFFFLNLFYVNKFSC